MRPHWTLEPGALFLNHGSFGATPRVVLDAQTAWRDRMERQPVRFFVSELPGLLNEASAAVAEFLGSPAKDLVFVENATSGANAVLRSLRFQPGDAILYLSHGYNAVVRTLEHVAGASGASLRELYLPCPVRDTAQILHKLSESLNKTVKLAVLDHVTSFSGLVLPLQEMVAMCRARGVPVLVDGAHAPGMLPLDLPAIGADWYVGNLHKWLCAAKGTAVLYASERGQEHLHPTVISHGYGQGFHAEFDFVGTRDCSGWLASTAALDFHRALGPEALRAYNRGLALWGRSLLMEGLGAVPAGPEDMIGSLAAVRLPESFGPGTLEVARQLHDALWTRHSIEVPVSAWGGGLWLRVSGQAYNERWEYEELLAALREIQGQS